MTPKTLLSRILFILYLAAIGLICFMSAEHIPSVQREIFGLPTDKVVHFCMFLPFPVLAYLAWDHKHDKAWAPIVFAIVVFLVGAGVAGLTEYIQDFLPTRSMDLHDFKADAYALAISTVLVFLIDITHLKTRKNN